MTDNPYASPESSPPTLALSPAARGIQSVATFFRVLGWIIVVAYGTIAVGAILGTIIAICFSWEKRLFEPDDAALDNFYLLLISVGYAGLSYIGWLFVSVSRSLLHKHPRSYRTAILYSCLMLVIFPLAPFGIYSLVMLRKHWRAYCEEQSEPAADVASG